jgi:putative PIG3 family NAD(P)H quinone oxidoreductase
MKAVVITRPGGPEVLEIRDMPQPRPGHSEILVRVHAAGLNRADLLQRQGRYPAPPGVPQEVPGMEFAGEVAENGPGATRWWSGARVFGIVAGGAQAEYLVTQQDTVAALPDNLSWPEAATIPEVFITAHDALWTQARLAAKENVLIHAVGSGVGLAGVQLTRARGSVPYGTSRTADKLERAKPLGMADGIVLRESLAALTEAAQKWTGDRGFDLVLDLVGGPYVAASIEAMALRGRMMLVGTVAGSRAELNLGRVLFKRLELRGTVLRARPLAEKIAVTRAFADEVVPLLASGALRATLDREFPMAEVQAAHHRLESNDSFGKVVLLIP